MVGAPVIKLRDRVFPPISSDLTPVDQAQWLEVLDGKVSPAVDLNTGIEVTKVAVGAHRAAQEGRRIAL